MFWQWHWKCIVKSFIATPLREAIKQTLSSIRASSSDSSGWEWTSRKPLFSSQGEASCCDSNLTGIIKAESKGEHKRLPTDIDEREKEKNQKQISQREENVFNKEIHSSIHIENCFLIAFRYRNNINVLSEFLAFSYFDYFSFRPKAERNQRKKILSLCSRAWCVSMMMCRHTSSCRLEGELSLSFSLSLEPLKFDSIKSEFKTLSRRGEGRNIYHHNLKCRFLMWNDSSLLSVSVLLTSSSFYPRRSTLFHPSDSSNRIINKEPILVGSWICN